ncbi:unnamed protein product, partial [Ixodes hexagonus]
TASGTVLFRPTAKGQFSSKNRLSVARALMENSRGEGTATRINTRLNIAAVDVRDSTMIPELLATKSLAGIEVKGYIPAQKSQSVGIIRRLSPDESMDDVHAAIKCPVEIVRIQRLDHGYAARLHFDGPLPAQVELWGREYPVTPTGPRPYQCSKCGRFGHIAAGCTNTDACRTCTGRHARGACPRKDRPRCPNCQFDHSAFDRRCPAYARERAVIRIASTNGGKWAEARAAARTEADVRGVKTAPKQTQGQHPSAWGKDYHLQFPALTEQQETSREIAVQQQGLMAPAKPAQREQHTQTESREKQGTSRKYRRTYGPTQQQRRGEADEEKASHVTTSLPHVTGLPSQASQPVRKAARALST